MKYSEMNKRQQKAFKNVLYAARDLIGGLENTTYDNPKESPEYQRAVACLEDHDWLVKELYRRATTAIYDDGMVCFNERTVQKELRDINFCGKEWLMERCEKRITKMENEGICIG